MCHVQIQENVDFKKRKPKGKSSYLISRTGRGNGPCETSCKGLFKEASPSEDHGSSTDNQECRSYRNLQVALSKFLCNEILGLILLGQTEVASQVDKLKDRCFFPAWKLNLPTHI